MKQDKVKFFCQECGSESLKWVGKCPGCGSFNTMVEEIVVKEKNKKLTSFDAVPVAISRVEEEKNFRLVTPWKELDRTLGGGIVPGSLVLFGGEPGIGKSTLLLITSFHLAQKFGTVLYVSGEESPAQIKLRATRINALSDNLFILPETNLENIKNFILELKPLFLVIDSIQTIYSDNIPGAPGSVSQVRECTFQLMSIAKSMEVTTFIIGHVTKEGIIAGPRVLEHMVDCVLYLEGERHQNLRLLRSIKNRFGATDELGVFEMTEDGFKDIENPSQIFLTERNDNASGSAIISTLEGTRPILLEVQALVSPSNFGFPKRTSQGVDNNRSTLNIAVLEKRAGFRLADKDIYINVVGGIKLSDTGADLGICSAIASSLTGKTIDNKSVIIGEVGLTGEVRRVNQIRKRVKEAEKLGFLKCILPKSNLNEAKKDVKLKFYGVDNIKDAMEIILGN